MLSDGPDKADVIEFFGELGFRALPIPEETTRRTPDIFVPGAPSNLLVEIKTRRDGDEWRKALVEGSTADAMRWGAGPWAFTQAGRAHGQFNAYDPLHESHWLVWFSVRRESLADVASEQIRDSLLGIRDVIVPSGADGAEMRKCINAQESVFSKYDRIVAAIVSCGDGISMFANDMSPRIDEFRETEVFTTLSARGSWNDVTSLVSRGFLLFDGLPGERSSDAALQKYLARKYGFSVVFMSGMTSHAFSVVRPRHRKM